jgi:O-antigen/teichoic acid export membrane protein
MSINKEFRRGGFILLVMMVLANALNYLFQVLMGRMLTVEEFGTMNALFSWVAIVTMPVGVVTTTTARYIATYKATGESFKIAKLLRRLFGYLALGAVVVLVFGAILSPTLSKYSNINNTLLIVLLSVTLSTGMFLPLLTGAVQGTKQFLKLGLLNFGSTSVKLVLGVGLVWLGYHLYGVMTALIASNLAMTLVGLYLIRSYVKPQSRANSENLILGKKDIARYAMIAFAINLCIALLSNVDMVFVKRFFSDSLAGLYGTAALFGRLVIYIPSALVLAMFPIAAEAEASGSGSRAVLMKALFYVSGLSVLAAAVLNLFADLAVKLLMGAKFLPAVPYVRMTALMAIPVGLMVTLANYCMAIKKMRMLAVSLAVGCLGCLAAIEIYHPSIAFIIVTISITAISLFVFNLAYLFRSKELNVIEN